MMVDRTGPFRNQIIQHLRVLFVLGAPLLALYTLFINILVKKFCMPFSNYSETLELVRGLSLTSHSMKVENRLAMLPGDM